MAEVIPLRLVDRSRIVADWKCPRSRFWQYEYEARGITSSVTSIELWLGTLVHDALARIADEWAAVGTLSETFTDEVAMAAARGMYDSLIQASAGEMDAEAQDFANEQAALVEGLIRGFARYAWPRMISGKKVVAVEREVMKVIGGIGFMAKPDLILESEADKEWEYWEYKSTSSKRSEWMNSWATAVQLHSSIKAVEEDLGKAPSRVIVQGLFKGWVAYGKQSSPFCYGYIRGGNPPFTADQVRYEYASGFRRTPTWQLPGGVKAWVASMPDAILADQFPQTPPIFVKDSLVEAFFAQTIQRERVINDGQAMIRLNVGDQTAIDSILAERFPQHFDQCTPGWGRGCQFVRLCHGHVTNPLTEGFTWREPHHQPEVDQAAAEETE